MMARECNIILASSSPRRLQILKSHGIDVQVVPPYVDEAFVLAKLPANASPEDMVLHLALAKALSVEAQLAAAGNGGCTCNCSCDFLCDPYNPYDQQGQHNPHNLHERQAQHNPHNLHERQAQKTQHNLQAHQTQHNQCNYLPSFSRHSPQELIILAADTVVYKAGHGFIGKPKDRNAAIASLQLLCNTSHEVYTGIALLKIHDGKRSEQTLTDVSTVHFGDYNLDDIETFLNIEPPYDKAGAYGAQGYWARHIVRIEGDLENVIGLPWHALESIL